VAPPGLGFGLGLVAASFYSLFFLFACPLVSQVISFIYDVQVRGGGLDVSRDRSFCLLPCRVAVGLNVLYRVHGLRVSSL